MCGLKGQMTRQTMSPPSYSSSSVYHDAHTFECDFEDGDTIEKSISYSLFLVSNNTFQTLVIVDYVPVQMI